MQFSTIVFTAAALLTSSQVSAVPVDLIGSASSISCKVGGNVISKAEFTNAITTFCNSNAIYAQPKFGVNRNAPNVKLLAIPKTQPLVSTDGKYKITNINGDDALTTLFANIPNAAGASNIPASSTAFLASDCIERFNELSFNNNAPCTQGDNVIGGIFNVDQDAAKGLIFETTF